MTLPTNLTDTAQTVAAPLAGRRHVNNVMLATVLTDCEAEQLRCAARPVRTSTTSPENHVKKGTAGDRQGSGN